ncbi:MAG: endolytic transglycosylase MltG [Candidatus Woesebacteria bacterium]|nr:endolytic transglycosylase MltG [Candidatus Woesebacteria bacterium]
MKSRSKFSILISLGFIILIGFGLFFFEGTLPVDKTNKDSKIFVVEIGEGSKSIINKLAQENLIRNKLTFYGILLQLGIRDQVQAGDYRLSPSMTAYEIAKELTHGTLDRWVTIIEGWRKEEIADKIAAEFKIPAIEIINNSREGYLFPDTYLIPKDATAGAFIAVLENNFKNRFDDQLKSKIAKLGITELEAITLASIVEREARFEQDRVEVASIFLKRLNEGIPLQADATVQYALGYQAEQKSWWKSSLTFEDLRVNSVYNTYVNPGLPPAPISNPGLSSLKAVANARLNTPYLFYISDLNGKLHYARTLQDHNKNIDKYLK